MFSSSCIPSKSFSANAACTHSCTIKASLTLGRNTIIISLFGITVHQASPFGVIFTSYALFRYSVTSK